MDEIRSTGEDSPEPAQAQEQLLNGSWEGSDRTVASAVFFAFLIIGTVYFNGQAILAAILTVISMGMNDDMAVSPSREFMWWENLEHIAQMTKTGLRIALVISQYLLMLIPTLWLVKRWHSADIHWYMRVKKTSILEIALSIVAAVAFFPLNSAISHVFAQSLHVPDFLVRIGEIIFTSTTVGEFIWLVVVVAVTPAICEEMFFRGYAQRTLERTFGWKSIVIIGFIFGLYHLQPLGLLSLSGIGLLLGFLFYRSKSVLPSMAAHFTNNLLAILALYGDQSLKKAIQQTEGIMFWKMIVVSATLLGFVLYAYHLVTKNRMAEPIVEKAEPMISYEEE